MQQNHFTKISFYVVAHADDWQLFMCPNVYNDITSSNNKNVFIITTAGDAGKDDGYWKAREEGAKSSIRFCMAPLKNFSEEDGIRKFNSHNIFYWCAANTGFYFMRLPDGGIDGKGFSSNNFESLSKLRINEINFFTAVNNSTIYNSWKDFYETIESIIINESRDIAKRRINYINPDTTLNANDHADHNATGAAVQCMNISSIMHQHLFTGYSLNNAANSVNKKNIFWKIGMFAAYEKAVFDYCGYSTLKENADVYIKWCLCKPEYIIIDPNGKLNR